MTYVTAIGGEFPPRRRILSSSAIPFILAAFALASGAAAWLVDLDPVSSLPRPSFLKDTSRLSFDDRFSLDPSETFAFKSFPPSSLAQSVLRDLENKLQDAKGRLAQKLQSQDWRTTLINEPAPSAVNAVPLPRARPVEATLALQSAPSTAQPDDRTLLQKFSDLLPGALASLAPDGGLLNDGPDLAALGYNNLTAVYDISARVVYLPNGSKLEAHSGFGNLMDDPGHVSERNVGATPPNVYDLRPRERLFHGIPALRMIPVDNKGLFGRSGLLAHSYMMGPNGDSNGCVSFKNYEKFLKAFQNGEIKRLVVVASLRDSGPASRQSISQSASDQQTLATPH
jgi:Protein of unknown function (DUF2778)